MEKRRMDRLKLFYKLVMPAFKVISKRMQADYRAAFPVLLQRIEVDPDTTVLDWALAQAGWPGCFWIIRRISPG